MYKNRNFSFPPESPAQNSSSISGGGMAEEESEKNGRIVPAFPAGRVKKMVKLDGEIGKVSSEAVLLISLSTSLFLEFLAEKSMEVAAQKRRKTVKLEHIRAAAKRHPPTTDFLLDSLPMPSQPPAPDPAAQSKPCRDAEKPPPPGTRRIDSFFSKHSDAAE